MHHDHHNHRRRRRRHILLQNHGHGRHAGCRRRLCCPGVRGPVVRPGPPCHADAQKVNADVVGVVVVDDDGDDGYYGGGGDGNGGGCGDVDRHHRDHFDDDDGDVITLTLRISDVLKGDAFDRDCVSHVVEFMKSHGVNFISGCVPLAFSKQGGQGGAVAVKYKVDDVAKDAEFDTVLIATGR